MTDELSRIEEGNAQRDLGVMAVRVYQGALEEAEGDQDVAFAATVACLEATFRSVRGGETGEAER